MRSPRELVDAVADHIRGGSSATAILSEAEGLVLAESRHWPELDQEATTSYLMSCFALSKEYFRLYLIDGSWIAIARAGSGATVYHDGPGAIGGRQWVLPDAPW